MTKKKKTIKINFRNFWGYFNPNDNFFINILKKDYKVMIDNHPRYIFYSVFGKKSFIYSKPFLGAGKFIREHFSAIYRFLKKVYYFKREDKKIPILKGNFIKIFYSSENIKIKKEDMENCDWAFTYEYDEELNHPRHLRLPGYKVEGDKLCKEIVNKRINMKKMKKEKIKFCNFIYSNHVPFRNRFFKKLNKYKKVESWGKCCNNMGQKLSGRIGYEGRLKPDKKALLHKPREFLNQFKFTISFENSCYPGYTTEKILEPMSVNSIPIFWGNPLIHRDFNTKSFINYHDFERDIKNKIPKIFFRVFLINKLTEIYLREKTMNQLVKKVIELDNDEKLYEKYLKQPWYNNNKPSKYVDDEIIRKRFKQIFG